MTRLVLMKRPVEVAGDWGIGRLGERLAKMTGGMSSLESNQTNQTNQLPSRLSMRSIGKQFGATRALRDVSLTVAPGQVMALIGENGAGKSTLMKILSGAIAPDQGEMTFEGRPYRPRGPLDARDHGIAMIYQELNLAPELSVEDNLMLGMERHRLGWLRRREQRALVASALDRLGHGDLDVTLPVHRLSLGMQQLIEIARALVAESKLVVLDEPTSSLTQRDVERLFDVVRKLRDQDISVIYISHFLEEISEVCDHYTVLRDGRSVGTGALADTDESTIVERMVGRSVSELFPQVPHQPAEDLLRIEQLSAARFASAVDLTVRRGEILGIAGLVGAGRTELLRAIMSLDPVRSGQVRISGNVIRTGIARRTAAGMGMVSEDRKNEGLAQSRSIADNLTLNRLKPYSTLGWLDLARRDRVAGQWMNKLEVKARSPQQEVQTLSGGNQQKVAIARVLHQDADLLLLDEPTRGIDVGTKAEIYRLMGEQAAAGKAILFVSSYLPELMAISDRLAVMSRGEVREIRPTGEWTETEVMRLATVGLGAS